MPWHWGANAHSAAVHGSGVCCASPLRHLRAGAATHSGGVAGCRCPYVGSRFSLKQRPCFLCGGMASAQGFLSTWSLEPTAIPEEVDRVVVSSPAPPKVLGAAADKTPPLGTGAPGASTKDKPANDRASPRVAPVHLLRKGVWSPSATAGGGGLFHSKPKNLSHATLACDSF